MIKQFRLLFTSTLLCTCGRALRKGRMEKGSKGWILLLLLLFAFTPLLEAQTSHRALRSGNKAYKDKNFNEAKAEYNRALEADNSAKGNYNLGNALFKSGDYEEAAKKYEEAASLSTDPTVTSSAFRNLGDAQYLQENYKESVEAYKQSLRINPDDIETKYNLSKAIRQLQKQQQEQQSQDQQDQQGKERKDQQEQGQQQGQQEGEQQDPQNEEEQQQDQQSQQQQKSQDQQQQKSSHSQQGEPPPNKNQPKMSREEAERQLAIAAEAEKETMKNLQKGARSGCKDGKDW